MLSSKEVEAKTHKDENGIVKVPPYKLTDEKSLYLLVDENGSKYWRMDYRFMRKRKTLALGVYPDVSLADARERRDAARKLLAQDPPIDPMENRKAVREAKFADASNSFEVVAREWWSSHMAGKAKSHRDKVIRRFELYLFPYIGKKPIADITAPEILGVVKRIEARGILETAHRTLQTAGQVFRYAVQTGRVIRDVTADLAGALPAAKTKHMAAFTEPDDVAELLLAIDGFRGSFTVLCALRLAPMLFARPGELRTARWADIDLENGVWSYLVGKRHNMPHIVPLPKQAVEILRELHLFSGTGEYVFQGGHSPKRPMSEAAVNAALKRMGYDTANEITGHGFRATARTLLHERLGLDPNVIEHQLTHSVPDALGTAYNRTKFILQRREMMQKWADYLDELKAGAKVRKPNREKPRNANEDSL